jgi:hypothetical protein
MEKNNPKNSNIPGGLDVSCQRCSCDPNTINPRASSCQSQIQLPPHRSVSGSAYEAQFMRHVLPQDRRAPRESKQTAQSAHSPRGHSASTVRRCLPTVHHQVARLQVAIDLLRRSYARQHRRPNVEGQTHLIMNRHLTCRPPGTRDTLPRT